MSFAPSTVFFLPPFYSPRHISPTLPCLPPLVDLHSLPHRSLKPSPLVSQYSTDLSLSIFILPITAVPPHWSTNPSLLCATYYCEPSPFIFPVPLTVRLIHPHCLQVCLTRVQNFGANPLSHMTMRNSLNFLCGCVVMFPANSHNALMYWLILSKS